MEFKSEAEIHTKTGLRTGFLLIALFFSILGTGLAFYATGLTFKLTVSGFIDPAGCSYNDWISCDMVLATNYAKMLGVPVAWWGFLFYLWASGALIYALVRRKRISGYGSAVMVLFISSIAVLFSFFKMYQLFILGVLCPVCVGMYIANFGIFFFSMKSGNVTFKNFKNSLIDFFKARKDNNRTPHPFRYFVFIIWVFAMGFLGMKYYENVSVKPNSANIQTALTRHYSQEQVKINTDNVPVTGNPAAEIKIIEFSDFECPACKLLSDNMKIILLDYGSDAAALYYMNYPLDKSINPDLKNEIHKNAGLAAIAAVAAQNQGDFWNFQYRIFENQTRLDREFLIELAVEQGLDKEKFISDIDSEETKMRVIEDIAEAKKIGVNATPSVFINGRKVEYWNSPEIIRAIIEEEMKR